jgi:hypothetical protein
MSNFTKVSFNKELGRYELNIDGVLKAHSEGNNDAEHEIGKDNLIKMAEQKGYDVTVVNKSANK